MAGDVAAGTVVATADDHAPDEEAAKEIAGHSKVEAPVAKDEKAMPSDDDVSVKQEVKVEAADTNLVPGSGRGRGQGKKNGRGAPRKYDLSKRCPMCEGDPAARQEDHATQA